MYQFTNDVLFDGDSLLRLYSDKKVWYLHFIII